jgi:transposase
MTTAGTHPCARCAELEPQFEQLKARVAQLEAELAAAKKNSTNSSKPPSSDIIKPSKKTKSRKKRRRGGQKGHVKHTRPLFPDDEVDFVDLRCTECPDCVSVHTCQSLIGAQR